MSIFSSQEVIYLLVALLLGSVLGIERTLAKKTAGVRTYGLVAMGACLFILMARAVMPSVDLSSPGPLYVLQGLIVGIGFIGGGTILRTHEHNHEHTTGLTTAAGLWITAGIGAATGFGLIELSLVATLGTLLVFTLFWIFEHRYLEKE